jgi:hypothetical protein
VWRCNRLGTKKLCDITYIKSELRHRHANNGIASKRLKQQFGNPEPTTNTNVAAASGAQNCVEDEEMVRVAKDSNESDGESSSESDEDESTASRLRQPMRT